MRIPSKMIPFKKVTLKKSYSQKEAAIVPESRFLCMETVTQIEDLDNSSTSTPGRAINMAFMN